MNTTIEFMLKSGLSQDETQQTLEQIRGLSGLFNASALNEKSKNPVVSRMYTASFESAQAAQDALPRIQALPVIESAEIPAPRGLIW